MKVYTLSPVVNAGSKQFVGGINVFGNTFNLWMADAQTAEARKSWISVLDKIEGLQPKIVILANANSSSPFDISAVKHAKSCVLCSLAFRQVC